MFETWYEMSVLINSSLDISQSSRTGSMPPISDRAQIVGDDQEVTLSTGDAIPPPGQAHVYRVTATQQGQVFGGYTVVLLG
jgi:hypothetical protein